VKSEEIRNTFLKFFEEKQHTIIPSSSLIPKGDPTLLLTTAGMVQIKPYFLGESEPPNHRLTSCQKCFRTTDIESVGDSSHLTFFEMLGNFSVGNYFKKEAIAWAWELVTERFKLTPEKLWVSIFLDDDESFGYWREIGVPASRILRFGEKDNFWGPAGNSGPCGPSSEIHYDFGEGVGCGSKDCKPNCGCARFVEVWNLVFTQYNQDETGKRTPLPKPNIDTGMGLERIVAVIGGKKSVYETDLLWPMVERVSELAGKKYGSNEDIDNAIRVAAEHGRGLPFLVADGVIPSNEGRGYVLRRILRRAALFGRRLGLDKPFLTEIARTTIEHMGYLYPELKQRQDFIFRVIELEEAKFEETLNTGLEIIENMMAKKDGHEARKISGKEAFTLYDTYGFPVELTQEIVGKSGFTVDMQGFETEMERQRERARASHKFETAAGAASAVKQVDVAATSFVGYEQLAQKAKVVRIFSGDQVVKRVEPGSEADIILDATPFYGEMGGQLGDTGKIKGLAGCFQVTDTLRITPDIILHRGRMTEGDIAEGEEVEAVVDRERRLDIARNHTATHLLQAALKQVLGDHVQQRGSLVAPERLRFDFSHLEAMTPEEIKQVQHIVNEKVRQNLAVCGEQMAYKEAVAAGAVALFDEKYGDVVRVMTIGEPAVSTELCGGTHISYTGEIGYFHILSESSIGAGLRRIEAVTGREAENYIEQDLSRIQDIAQILEASSDNVQSKVEGILAELDKERKIVLSLQRELAKKEAESLVDSAEVIKGVKLVAARVTAVNMQVLREMADYVRDKLGSAIVVLGTVNEARPMFLAAVTPDLVKQGYNAGDIIKQVSKVAGGGGGGKPNFAQAGGKNPEKLDEALSLVKSLI
jgi:alanyl-tRNA synthetase